MNIHFESLDAAHNIVFKFIINVNFKYVIILNMIIICVRYLILDLDIILMKFII